MQTVELLYGRGTLPVEVPDDAVVIRKPAAPKLPDPHAAIADAFAHPIGCEPPAELAKGASSACILVCDITRPVPNGLFLRPLIEQLMSGGIPAEGIVVVVATGLHRKGSDAELEEILGDPWVRQTVRCEWHDARDDDLLVHLGTTSGDVPVYTNRNFVEADVRIATGLVEPHFMAGWSGGRKVISPGVAGQQTIRTFHSARFMEDPKARELNLDGNPLHRAQLEIVQMIGDCYAVNTVIDEERDLNFVSFGEIEASHLAAVDFVQEFAKVSVGRTFSTIVTSSAGYPLDKTYYQTQKGMVTPLDILEPGGTVIIASECSEGFGSPEFRKAQQEFIKVGHRAFIESLLPKPQADIDEWQTVKLTQTLRVGDVELYSPELSEEDLRDVGVTVITDLDAAIADAVAKGDGSIAVIPEGPYLIPVV